MEGIRRRAARAGQVMAFLAALFLSFNLHPPHAHADADGGHGHSGIFCEAHDLGQSSPDGETDKSPSHADCIHHFDPLLRAPAEYGVRYVHRATAPPHIEPLRQEILSFDPPPPRYPS